MQTALDYLQVLLLLGWLVVSLWGWISDAREQADLRNEVELLNERMDRAGLPHRLPVHVVTDLGDQEPEAAHDPDVTDTTVMPVVGRHRIERLRALPSLPEPREVAEHAPLVDVDD